jgi:hypothetical protein
MTTRQASIYLASYPPSMRVVEAPRLVFLNAELNLTDSQLSYWLMLEAHGYVTLAVS